MIEFYNKYILFYINYYEVTDNEVKEICKHNIFERLNNYFENEYREIKDIRNFIKYFRVIMIYKRMLRNDNFIKYVENVDKNNEDNRLYNELYKEIRNNFFIFLV